jgi:HEAT repeat protein
MDKKVKQLIGNLGSPDDKVRMNALNSVLKLTDQKVNWAYDVWDDLFEMLEHENSFHRSIAIKVICNLAKSDSEDRLSKSLDILLAHTKDEKFITSRQCIQSIWKVAVANRKSRKKVLAHLEKRFSECVDEKHYSLIRADIIQSIKFIYDAEKDDKLLTLARSLIAEEKDVKYRKKYEAILG